MTAKAVAPRRLEPGDDAGFAAYVAIRNAVTPENADSLEQVAWQHHAYPGQGAHLVVHDDHGRTVAAASTGRIWMYPQEHDRYWIGIWVLPDVRRRGIGDALYVACSEIARAAGKSGFETELSEVHADGLDFLARRGFTVTERSKMVRLSLAALEPPEPAPPPGIRLVTLAERPDLVAHVHAVAVEALPDIPFDDEPVVAGDLEAFAVRDVDRAGIPKDAFFVAIDEATGDVVGYASLMVDAGDPKVAFHDMTAVRRAYRGRGIAGALKRATIAWAVRAGMTALDTGNDERNGPMRAVNAALGYQPMPDWLGLEGPLAPVAVAPSAVPLSGAGPDDAGILLT